MQTESHNIEHMIPVKRYILLGEDDEDDLGFFKEAFSSRLPHIDIVHFDNGRALMGFLKGCPYDSLPDFMLLDHLMPMLSAMDILKLLQKEPRYDKIVKAVWSTLILPVDWDRCMALGCSYYFDKPVSKMEWHTLAATIGSYYELSATGS